MKTSKTDRNLAFVLAAAFGATMAVAGGAAAIETVPSPLRNIENAGAVSNEAEAHYLAGLEHERRGDLQAAVDDYHDAAEDSHSLAKKKLGDIFGTGSDAVGRDYQTSLKWYLKARMAGVEIRNKPIPCPGIRP